MKPRPAPAGLFLFCSKPLLRRRLLLSRRFHLLDILSWLQQRRRLPLSSRSSIRVSTDLTHWRGSLTRSRSIRRCGGFRFRRRLHLCHYGHRLRIGSQQPPTRLATDAPRHLAPRGLAKIKLPILAWSFGRWLRCSLLTDPWAGYARRSRLISGQNPCAIKGNFILARPLKYL